MAGLRAVRAMLIGEPLQLPTAVLTRHPELCGVRFRRGGLPPRLAGLVLGRSTVTGITLWRTIFLAPGARLSAELLLHELRHVHQFEASPVFPLRYVWETVRRGYWRNRFEADARAFARARVRAASVLHPSQDE